jgi:uncharacterized protein YodC (DUF2158 family)
MTNDIKAGDVVQLNSGGPRMTVTEVKNWNGKMTAYCSWFVNEKNHSDSFPVSSLKTADAESAIYRTRS